MDWAQGAQPLFTWVPLKQERGSPSCEGVQVPTSGWQVPSTQPEVSLAQAKNWFWPSWVWKPQASPSLKAHHEPKPA
jgi:hypothetical protein